VSALWFGRVAAMFASALAVLAFNYFFTEPRFTLNINDTGYLGHVRCHARGGCRRRHARGPAREQRLRAWSRERATAAQHALSRELAAARDARGVASRSLHDTRTTSSRPMPSCACPHRSFAGSAVLIEGE
jgi:K+-sensing histidine kinase KdpD